MDQHALKRATPSLFKPSTTLLRHIHAPPLYDVTAKDTCPDASFVQPAARPDSDAPSPEQLLAGNVVTANDAAAVGAMRNNVVPSEPSDSCRHSLCKGGLESDVAGKVKLGAGPRQSGDVQSVTV